MLRSPLFWKWHYQQMLSRLVLGGRVPEVDKEYTVGAFYKVFFMSCCGLCASKITTFVDSHIVFDLSKPIKGPDAEELHELEQLRHDDAADAAAAGASGIAAASIAFEETRVTGGGVSEGGQLNPDRAKPQVAITVEEQAPAVGPLTAPAPSAPTLVSSSFSPPTSQAASIPTMQVRMMARIFGFVCAHALLAYLRHIRCCCRTCGGSFGGSSSAALTLRSHKRWL